MFSRIGGLPLLALLATLFSFTRQAVAYRVAISDTDSLREVCSGMWGGKDAFIEIEFDSTSAGQVALVIYEWKDVPYLGVDTPDNSVGGVARPKTYICTTSAVRSGLCTTSSLGSFITSLPSDRYLNDTSIFTTALKFDQNAFPVEGGDEVGDEVGEPLGVIPGDEDEDENEDEVTGGTEDGSDTIEDGEESSRPGEVDDAGTGIPDEAQGEGEVEVDEGFNTDDSNNPYDDHEETSDEPVNTETQTPAEQLAEEEAALEEELKEEVEAEEEAAEESGGGWWARHQGGMRKLAAKRASVKRQWGDILDGVTDGVGSSDETMSGEDEADDGLGSDEEDNAGDVFEEEPAPTSGSNEGTSGISGESVVVTYAAPITYAVKKTGYYCIGIVPVTLVNSERSLATSPARRQASSPTHAEYSGRVLFKNTFDGELPAVEYPKIGFYAFLSVVYFGLGLAWAYSCFRHRDELLPMQYYISGTIAFLIIEMLAQFAYYRYINKHGGGTSSLAFLFVIAILNAARNSLSFFLLLIVSMGLSVVTTSLGEVMKRVRVLTGFHFLFGVLYSIGTVEVELDSASLAIVLILIFPLALTLTAFLMWIIISLNGTIMHLQAKKQQYKLKMFQKLWRILIMAVIAIAAFFVVSSMSLSNRLDEDYAPNNWRYRWILLDASLATIYLFVFSAIAYLWRPTRDSVRFAMSQQLAQDEDEADAEDYELENGHGGHQRVATGEDDDEDDPSKPFGGRRGKGVEDGNVVFAMGDDSDDEDGGEGGKKGGYRDMDRE